MPYFVHLKSEELTPDGLACTFACTFTDRAIAHKYATDLTLMQGVAWMVSFRVSAEEINDWHNREASRFDDGDYLNVPWNGVDVQRSELYTHFVHLSTVHPGMVAYTPSDEHGVQDRQVRLKPGKYLAEFYEAPGYMTHSQVQSYVTQCQIVGDNQHLSFAQTPEDIVRVYEGADPAPLSCMVRQQNFLRTRDRHPCEVYGNSDLAVAYYGPIDAVEARAIVWPDKHRYSRVYGTRNGGHVGTNGERLKRLLTDAGYSSGSIDGAKIRHIDYNGSYLMPYIDNVDYAEDMEDGFIRLGEGRLSTSETCGYVSGERDDPDDEDDEDDRDMRRCEHCNDSYDGNAEGEESGYCQSCYDSHWICEHCDNEQFDQDSHRVNRETWCDDCYTDAMKECANDDCSHMWIEVVEFSPEETTVRTAREIADLCPSCAAKYVWCDSCEVSYDTQVCPECERSPRCDRTADLLTVRQSNMFRLEVLDSEPNSGWTGCCFSTNGYGRATDVGAMNYMIELREHAQLNHPTAQYRITPIEVITNVATL